MNDKVVTRIAPSPTGPMHIGTLRTSLFNFLYARKHHQGKFILRIEDTDRERSKKEYEQDIFRALEWLGIPPDEWARQSDRGEIYKQYLKKLLESKHGYLSREESKNEPGKEVDVVRLRNPGKAVSFNDEVRGEVTFDTGELGDFVVAKDMETPLYHLAVVVDDYEMGVTDVIRGEDHISNTPRQILIQEALGFPQPRYTHLPMILAPDKSKLSKRKGQVAVSDYIDQGFLPIATINFLALLGWGPGDDREFFTREELIDIFNLENIQKSGAVFNINKLKWFNDQYLKQVPDEEFLEKAEEYLPEEIKKMPNYSREMLFRIIPIIRERIEVYYEIEEMARAGEMNFFFDKPDYEVNKLKWKEESNASDIRTYLSDLKEMIENISENNFEYESIKAEIWDYASEKGRGEVLWPFRYALSGRDKSPDPFLIAEKLGKKEAIERLDIALDKLQD